LWAIYAKLKVRTGDQRRGHRKTVLRVWRTNGARLAGKYIIMVEVESRSGIIGNNTSED
jgi:hypothetical protein